MTEVFVLPDNFIGKEDREKLESFAAHEISHGRATRWAWSRRGNGDDRFAIYRGGVNEELVAIVGRDRKADAFYAGDGDGKPFVTGALDHVMAGLDEWLAELHGERPS
ncbi:MAG: hypothetical protein LJE91_01165 [Gammaproteobacteria bacterium]|jgi:hypothetical protein|nr:hypothetical protein [Gammaproteobacteria bacterium]